jgi:primosomal protein N' (replication factor Y)
MLRIAKVIVDLAVGREFDYLIPAHLAATIQVGSRVFVPFRKSRITGYVVGLADRSEYQNLREILSLAGDRPFVDREMLRLAEWMGDYYCVSNELAIRTVLPGPVRRKGACFRKQMFVSIVPDTEVLDCLSAVQTRILDVLRSRSTGILLSDLLKEARVTAAPVRVLERKSLVKISTKIIQRDPFVNRTILRTEPLELMAQQDAALNLIRECVDGNDQDATGASKDEAQHGLQGSQPEETRVKTAGTEKKSHVVLLYGVTGSGKTEVYLQAIDHVLKKCKGAIVLVPEISLTPQTVERFVGRFGDRIAVLHSHLSDGERHDEWHRINDGKADIVVGARSAVFAPVRNLGLIVVDEEHEPSYKQEEAPRYNARDVAVMRGKIEKCAVVLGSATPSVESWGNTRSGKYGLARLPLRADGRKMPAVRVVDMRVEAERSGHVSVFSRELLEAIRSRLDRSEQVILFLNRRGFATSLICPKCGYVAKCDQCSVSYTYHRQNEELRCHICGGSHKVPARCPGCQDPAFKFTGIGTQRIENIISKCFPHAHVQRMDADVTTLKDSYDRIFGDFRVGKTDILIGTQMIAKGLHFPNVTLVGVIYADLSLHIPDFRAGERTFQLLAQVAGRAGRGEVAGEVIIQTYTPFDRAVQAARRTDFEGFCDQEIEFRRELSYPPFSHLVCLTIKGASEQKVCFCSSAFMKKLRQELSRRVMASEPCPAPLSKAKGFYRYQIMLRCPSVKLITEPVRDVLGDFKWPDGISCSVDVDAISLL